MSLILIACLVVLVLSAAALIGARHYHYSAQQYALDAAASAARAARLAERLGATDVPGRARPTTDPAREQIPSGASAPTIPIPIESARARRREG